MNNKLRNAIRKVEKQRKHPGKDMPLSINTIRNMRVIVAADEALDELEQEELAHAS